MVERPLVAEETEPQDVTCFKLDNKQIAVIEHEIRWRPTSLLHYDHTQASTLPYACAARGMAAFVFRGTADRCEVS